MSKECTGPALDIDFFRLLMGPQTSRELLQIENRNIIFTSHTHEAVKAEKKPDGRL